MVVVPGCQGILALVGRIDPSRLTLYEVVQECPTPTEELNICKEQLLKREEEIAVLKVERSNTRMIPKENNQEKILMDGVFDVNHEQENMPSVNGKASPWSHSLSGSHLTIQSVRGCWDLSPVHHRPSDSSLSHEEDLAKVIKLQEFIDKLSQEQNQMKERLAALSVQVTELEEDLNTARKDLLKSEEVNMKLQRDVHEVSDKGCVCSELECESDDVCGARSLGKMGACCVGSAEAALLGHLL
ncbi:hypothetical protein MG293_007316 [Ovis ammon polii]|uniref:Liprin-alpha CC2 domain-containing protein n=1 Tax=Ovis ammon polii TaxID=230172 RepID=A0AAD4Y9Q1_OVIAM|nr:hypothetical protein MG293_007316 [Ovis ammon polii]